MDVDHPGGGLPLTADCRHGRSSRRPAEDERHGYGRQIKRMAKARKQDEEMRDKKDASWNWV